MLTYVMNIWQEIYNSVAEGEPLTAEQKADIEAEAENRGVHINKRCSSCYRDALIQFIIQDRKAEQETEERKSNMRYWVLRKGLDVIFRGVRVNEATLTDALALRLHRAGFPNHLLWLRIPTEEELKERDEHRKEMFERMAQKRAEREASMTDEQRQRLQERREEAKRRREEMRARLEAKRAAETTSEAQSVETETEVNTNEAEN